MTDLRRHFQRMQKGLIFTALALFIDFVVIGIHIGYIFIAVGMILVAIEVKPLIKYSKYFNYYFFYHHFVFQDK